MEKLSIFESLKEDELNKVQSGAEQSIKQDNNKLNLSDLETVKTDTSGGQVIENNASNIEKIVDPVVSAGMGVADSLTYLMDLPFYAGQVMNFAQGKTLEVAGKAFGFNEKDINEMAAQMLIVKKGDMKFPGELIRDKALTYESKTGTGKVVRTIAEWAAPGGIIAKGAKAKKLFAATGAVSGGVKEGVEAISGSNGMGTGVAVVTNLVLDVAALTKGNASQIAKDIVPVTKQIIEKAKKIQKDAKKYKLIVTSGEAVGASGAGTNKIQAYEGTLEAYITGNKVLEKHWASRPEKLKNYINLWAKDMGLISNKETKVTNIDQVVDTMKKSAAKLNSNRTFLWKESGGQKLINTTFDAQTVDNLGLEVLELVTKSNDAPSKIMIKTVEGFSKRIRDSKGNGKQLFDIYKDIRDSMMKLQKTTSPSNASLNENKIYKGMFEKIKATLATNKDFGKAQKKYENFTKVYAEPLDTTITKVFKDLKKGNLSEADIVPRMYKILASDSVSPKMIRRFATAWNKSGNPDTWKKIVSGYFEQAFLNQSDSLSNGLNTGIVLHKAILGTGGQRDNFAQMLFELAKANSKPKTTIIYHGTGAKFKNFDTTKSADGSVWFTNLKSEIESGMSGASSSGRIIARTIDENNLKLATREQSDKFLDDQLIQQGFDGIKLDDLGDGIVNYRIFNLKKLQKNTKDNAPQKIKGKNITLTDVKQSVNSFAAVLKATGQKTNIGSPTAQRGEQVVNMKKNPISAVLDFVGVNRVIKYFDDLTFSQTADELSTAMVSDDGIDALINLAQNWKDKNAAVKYVKTLVGIETLAEDEF